MALLKAYLFRNKDPIIDQVRTAVQDHYGELNGRSLKDIEESGGASKGCTQGWFYGKTKRPQNATVEATLRSMGLERRIVKMKKE